jgi:energy-coupling factor transport system permease protein
MTTAIFGNYQNYNTPIHKMDPRVKMFCLIALMVMCFLPYGVSSYIDQDNVIHEFAFYSNQFSVLGIICILIGVIMIVAKISFTSFVRSLSAMRTMAIFLLIIMVFVPQVGNYEISHPIYTFANGYTIYRDGILQTGQILLRLIMMVALSLILTSTTSPMDIMYGFEWYLSPLKLVKFPTQVISMTLSLSLRFIPTLLDETVRITKAQKSRGVDYNRGFISTKIKSVTTLIVPLLVSCFSKSEDLALAMEARGYDPYAKRTRYRILHFRWQDLISLILLLLVFAFFIFLTYIAQTYRINYRGYFGIHGGR